MKKRPEDPRKKEKYSRQKTRPSKTPSLASWPVTS